MTNVTLKKAMVEAERFLEIAKIVELKGHDNVFTFYGCKETGALRRASMDLTRALAELRHRQI
jgi:hypothetical protein